MTAERARHAPKAVQWGFIGAGGIATNSLAPAVRAARGARLYAVAAREVNRARRLHPDVAYPNYEAVLADPAVDVVYVALHNTAHREWVERALTAGKHVLCEKPLGMTAGEVESMNGAARRSSTLLVEAMWNRWHPRTRLAEQLIADGALGTVRQVKAEFDTAAPAAGNYRLNASFGGGALFDVGPYTAAAVLSAAGWREPSSASAASYLTDDGVDEATTAELAFDLVGGGTAVGAGGDGIRGRISVAIRGGWRQRVTVIGDLGELDLCEPAFTAGEEPARLAISGAVQREWYFAPVNPYRLMVEQFTAVVRGEAGYLVPLAESYTVARTLDLIRAASTAWR